MLSLSSCSEELDCLLIGDVFSCSSDLDLPSLRDITNISCCDGDKTALFCLGDIINFSSFLAVEEDSIPIIEAVLSSSGDDPDLLRLEIAPVISFTVNGEPVLLCL